MQVWLLCSEDQKKEIGYLPSNFHLSHGLEAPPSFDAVVDLLFETNRQVHQNLFTALSVPVLVSSPVITCRELPDHFVRINGWPGFLQGRRVEACGNSEAAKASATEIIELLGKEPEWVPDEPGIISPRIVAGIVNEAYLAWSEGIASKADIDTAMKLGTNYPHGPFEWAELIGRERIVHLLETLAAANKRYQPCSALKNSIAG